ncbi:hypothetical protein ACUSRM_000655 [Vibrio alginolyticus]
MKRINRERSVEKILAETNRKLTQTNNVLVKLEQEAIEQSKVANDISRTASRASIFALIIAMMSIMIAVSTFVINDLREKKQIAFEFLMANRDKAIDYIDNTGVNIYELNYACEEISELVVKDLSENNLYELKERVNYIYETYGLGAEPRRKLHLLLSGHEALTNWIEQGPYLTTHTFDDAIAIMAIVHLIRNSKGEKISRTKLSFIFQDSYSGSSLDKVLEIDKLTLDEMKEILNTIYEDFLISQIVLDGVEGYLYRLSFNNMNEDDTQRLLSESVELTLDYFADYEVTSSVCSFALSNAVENLKSKLPFNSVQSFY